MECLLVSRATQSETLGPEARGASHFSFTPKPPTHLGLCGTQEAGNSVLSQVRKNAGWVRKE